MKVFDGGKCTPRKTFSIIICDLSSRNNWATSWQTSKMACAASEDSDQPGHPPSLIRVFAARMKKAWVLYYPLSAQRRLWPDCPVWSVSSLGAHAILLVLSWGGSTDKVDLWSKRQNSVAIVPIRCRIVKRRRQGAVFCVWKSAVVSIHNDKS